MANEFWSLTSQGKLPPRAKTDLAADLANPATSTGAALQGRVGSELYSDFRSLPNGAVPAKFDTGQAFTYVAETPIIQGGAFTTPTTTTTGKATYLEPKLAGKVRRIGAEFVIRRTTPEQTNGSLCIGAWSDPGVSTTFPAGQPYPVAGAHFVINKDRWTYNFYADANPADVASGTFTTPLAEGVPLRVELAFEGTRVVILLPDGTRATFTDPRVEQYIHSRPFWEPYMQGGNANTNVGITQVWADSVANEQARDRYATKREVALATAARPVEAYTVQWKPTSDKYVNLTTTQTNMHADMYVDIPMPASKQFVITATAALEKAGVSVPYWAFTANTSLTVGIAKLSSVTGLETVTTQVYVDLSANGSFQAGNTVRIAWAQYMSGTDRITFQARTGAWPTLTVTPVNGKIVTAA